MTQQSICEPANVGPKSDQPRLLRSRMTSRRTMKITAVTIPPCNGATPGPVQVRMNPAMVVVGSPAKSLDGLFRELADVAPQLASSPTSSTCPSVSRQPHADSLSLQGYSKQQGSSRTERQASTRSGVRQTASRSLSRRPMPNRTTKRMPSPARLHKPRPRPNRRSPEVPAL